MAQTNLDNEKRALSELFDPKKYGSQGEWKKLDRLCLSKDAGEYVIKYSFYLRRWLT
jgi:protein kinase C substrate 80K-H